MAALTLSNSCSCGRVALRLAAAGGGVVVDTPVVKFTRSATAAKPTLLDEEDGEVETGEDEARAAPVGFSPTPVLQFIGGLRAGGVEAGELAGDVLAPRGRRALRTMAVFVRTNPAETALALLVHLFADEEDGEGERGGRALGLSGGRLAVASRGSLIACVVIAAFSIKLFIEGCGVCQSMPLSGTELCRLVLG